MTSNRPKLETPRLRDYLAGAAVADGLILLASLALSYTELSTDSIRLAMFFATYVGTAMAGFLVTGKIHSRYLPVGLMTGMISYILYIIPVTVVFHTTSADLWHPISFFFGACTGAQIRENKSKKKNKR